MSEQQKKMAVGLGTTTAANSKNADLNPLKSTKLATILGLLISGRSLNRFEAEHHHDHCLNSTISTLQNGYGITIERKRESVPCLDGMANVSVNRYWLNTKPDNVKRAYEVLNHLERKA